MRASQGTGRTPVQMRVAAWPQDLGPALHLLQAYLDFLRNNPIDTIPINVAEYERELATLATKYDGKNGVLMLAWLGSRACGCAAVQFLRSQPDAAEMKRLYVAPAGRSQGLGRLLIEACTAWARAHGARQLLLDTVPAAMPAAVRLYRDLGFVPAERYHDGDLPGLAFFRLPLE